MCGSHHAPTACCQPIIPTMIAPDQCPKCHGQLRHDWFCEKCNIDYSIKQSTNYVQVIGSPAEFIEKECERIKQLLLEKNKNYGSSVLVPSRIFSSADPREQILVRIDDKLTRIKNGNGFKLDEDTVEDLIGYLILLRVYDEMNKPTPKEWTDGATFTTTGDTEYLYWDMQYAKNKEKKTNEGSHSCGRDGDKTSSCDKSNE